MTSYCVSHIVKVYYTCMWTCDIVATLHDADNNLTQVGVWHPLRERVFSTPQPVKKRSVKGYSSSPSAMDIQYNLTLLEELIQSLEAGKLDEEGESSSPGFDQYALVHDYSTESVDFSFLLPL